MANGDYFENGFYSEDRLPSAVWLLLSTGVETLVVDTNQCDCASSRVLIVNPFESISRALNLCRPVNCLQETKTGSLL